MQIFFPRMKLVMQLEDESGDLEAVMFGSQAENFSGVNVTQTVISVGADLNKLPEIANQILNKEFDFIIGNPDQACDAGVLKYKIFKYSVISKDSNSHEAKGKAIIGSTSGVESEKLEQTQQTPTKRANAEVPEEANVSESPSVQLLTALSTENSPIKKSKSSR